MQNNKIGRWHGAGLLATTLLGTSVFILPQLTIDIAGKHALLAWLGLTLAILPVAIVFARLSGHFPHAAGPAFFVERAFGVTAGRTIGLSFLMIVPIGAPAALIMTYQFVAAIFAIPESNGIWVMLSFIVLLFFLNIRGIKLSATLQLLLALTIAAILVALSAINASQQGIQIQGVKLMPFNSSLLAAAGLAFWSFLGIEAMSHLANDFKNPKKDLLPAIISGTMVVGVIYLVCTYLLIVVPSTTDLKIVGVFDAILGGGGSVIIGWLGLAGGLATVNVYTASLTRLLCSFSQDKVLPQFFAKQNRHGVSGRALVLLLTIMAIVLIIADILAVDLEQLLNLVNGVFVVIYFASMLAAIRLLGKGYYLLIGLGCFFCLLMVMGIGGNMVYAASLLCICAPLLWMQNRWQNRQKNACKPVCARPNINP